MLAVSHDVSPPPRGSRPLFSSTVRSSTDKLSVCCKMRENSFVGGFVFFGTREKSEGLTHTYTKHASLSSPRFHVEAKWIIVANTCQNMVYRNLYRLLSRAGWTTATASSQVGLQQQSDSFQMIQNAAASDATRTTNIQFSHHYFGFHSTQTTALWLLTETTLES